MTAKFTEIRGIAVPLLWDNIDTDALAPAAPHKAIGGGRDRLREILFYEFRFGVDGKPKSEFLYAAWNVAAVRPLFPTLQLAS